MLSLTKGSDMGGNQYHVWILFHKHLFILVWIVLFNFYSLFWGI